ncbi:hypothetical protein LTR56_008275 [Elasticomyces elasticus]|nr:hypothetical protein LTR56_008275 [Elasticomyces elasticus]KAK3661838.1 hypothetical protein LTR22_007421 [Elasticomyces elasticus]KAK4924442.1 hypothetical protein LTR49_008533 [Elasticomyces elasticus]
MAAAGFDKRSSAASSLQTPGSGGFPSEMRSPMTASPSFMKQKENDLKTPITPPSAYLDFLKSMSPAMLSPAPTSTSARFSFHGDRTSDTRSDTTEKPSISPPTPQPALSRNSSYESTASTASGSSFASASSSVASGTRRSRPESPRVTIPPSPFAKPALRSARTPRKLHIPQSPFSAGMPSASMSSYNSTPLSAAPWSASYAPPDVDTETNGKPGKVTVKQVVTRTFTYCRTPLEAVPDGSLWKRRKVEHDETTSKESSEEPRVKEEIPEETTKEASEAASEPTIKAEPEPSTDSKDVKEK